MVVAVTSDTRGPQFESSHRQCYNEHLVITVNCIKKMIVMKKRPAMAHSLKRLWVYRLAYLCRYVGSMRS